MGTYKEEIAKNEIEKYLVSCKNNKKSFRDISIQLYNNFTANDDKHLIKLIKKILIIYKRFHTKLLQSMFHKWQIIILKLYDGKYYYNNSILNSNEYDNEFEKSDIENNENLYINELKKNIKYNIRDINSPNNKSNNKFNKKREGPNKNNAINKCPININNNNCDDLFKELNQIDRLNKAPYNNKEEKSIETNNNKTFEGPFHTKNFENNNYTEQNNNKSFDNLKIDSINNKQKEIFIMNEYNLNKINSNDLNNENNYNIYYIYNPKIKYKSKSIGRARNTNNFITLSSKPWGYSYNKNNYNNNIINRQKKKSPSMNNLMRQDLFNNLYDDQKKRYEKLKKLNKEKEDKFNTIYTFTPKLIPNKLNEKYFKNLSVSKFNKMPDNNEDNATSLITNSNNNSSLNNIRLNVYKNNKKELGNAEDNPLDFLSRLAEYEKIKKMKLEKIKNEFDIKSKKRNNTYKNNNYKNKIPDNHLLNNSKNYFDNKQKNIEKITKNMNKEQGITFRPFTNKKFNDKIKDKMKKNVIERNNEFMKDRQEKIEKITLMKEKELTFKPKINSLSTMAILNKNKTGQECNSNFKIENNNQDVSKRLFDYQNKYKESLEIKRNKFKENYSFKPEISKNTDMILNNKKKKMEYFKENEENNLINDMKDGNKNELNNKNNNYQNYVKNNEILLKQKKLGKLEEISKRISELSEENMLNTEEKTNSPIKNNDKKSKKFKKSKLINENKEVYNNTDSLENNNFQKKQNSNNNELNYNNLNNNINYRNNISLKKEQNNENTEKIMELAKNLLKGDLSMQQNTIGTNGTMNYFSNRKKEGNNDWDSLMIYNNNKNINNKNSSYNNFNKSSKKNYRQKYDLDIFKGNKGIMNLDYYDYLLQ